jgi:GT2 family glycosyltransferase
MTSTSDLAVVVVSFNVRELLSRCLGSVADAGQVVVVDNGSVDGSADMVAEEFPGVDLLAWPDNRGFSAAVNAGAQRVRGEALLLLNPDASLPAGALHAMGAALDRRPRAWAIGFRQVDTNGRFQLAVGPPPSLALDLVRGLVQRALDRGDERVADWADRLLARSMRVPWVAGSSLLVRRDAFEQIRGFDERFFLYFEDIDFCLRLRRAGGEVWYEPSITVVHERGVSARTSNGHAERAYRHSQLWFWEKHRGRVVRDLVHRYQRLRGLAP